MHAGRHLICSDYHPRKKASRGAVAGSQSQQPNHALKWSRQAGKIEPSNPAARIGARPHACFTATSTDRDRPNSIQPQLNFYSENDLHAGNASKGF